MQLLLESLLHKEILEYYKIKKTQEELNAISELKIQNLQKNDFFIAWMNVGFSVPGLCASILGGMVFALGFNVSLNRRKYKLAGIIQPVCFLKYFFPQF